MWQPYWRQLKQLPKISSVCIIHRHIRDTYSYAYYNTIHIMFTWYLFYKLYSTCTAITIKVNQNSHTSRGMKSLRATPWCCLQKTAFFLATSLWGSNCSCVADAQVVGRLAFTADMYVVEVERRRYRQNKQMLKPAGKPDIVNGAVVQHHMVAILEVVEMAPSFHGPLETHTCVYTSHDSKAVHCNPIPVLQTGIMFVLL